MHQIVTNEASSARRELILVARTSMEPDFFNFFYAAALRQLTAVTFTSSPTLPERIPRPRFCTSAAFPTGRPT